MLGGPSEFFPPFFFFFEASNLMPGSLKWKKTHIYKNANLQILDMFEQLHPKILRY